MDPDVVLSPPPRVGAEAWVRGFHGVVVDLDGRSAASLRQVALSRRSPGTLRMGDLTLLPERVATRLEPSSDRGDRHVGGDDTPAVDAAPRAGVAPPDRPVPLEPLTAAFDRRLGEARFLLLPHRGVGYAVAKRSLDLTVAVALLLLAAPVMAALAVLIRLDSPGPAVFRQERVTRGGRTFRFYKFRTMHVDAGPVSRSSTSTRRSRRRSTARSTSWPTIPGTPGWGGGCAAPRSTNCPTSSTC